MSKETFYFSHDYNARNDKKISGLVREFKSAGYGVFWCAAEMLHEEGGELELDELTISAIAKDLNEDFELVEKIIGKCISSFKLFSLSSDNILTANRVSRNLDKRKQISKTRSEAGKAGAIAKQEQANAKQNEAKESKGKERKGKEIKKDSFNNFPLPTDFNGLPAIRIGSIHQLLKITRQIDLSDDKIMGMWEVFKIQSLTGKKHYHDQDSVYSYFSNWIKDKKFENEVKNTTKGNKNSFI